MKEIAKKLELPIDIPFGRDVCMVTEMVDIEYWPFSIKFTMYDDMKDKEFVYLISFDKVVAYQSIPSDVSGYLKFNNESSFNEVIGSEWVKFLEKNKFSSSTSFEGVRHYRLMFYEEVIEIIAREKPKIKRLW